MPEKPGSWWSGRKLKIEQVHCGRMGINNILSFKEGFAQYFLKDINRFLIFQVLSWWCFRGLIFRLQVCKLFSRHFPLCHFKMDTCNKELLLQTLFFFPSCSQFKSTDLRITWFFFFLRREQNLLFHPGLCLYLNPSFYVVYLKNCFTKCSFAILMVLKDEDEEKTCFLQLCFAKVC